MRAATRLGGACAPAAQRSRSHRARVLRSAAGRQVLGRTPHSPSRPSSRWDHLRSRGSRAAAGCPHSGITPFALDPGARDGADTRDASSPDADSRRDRGRGRHCRGTGARVAHHARSQVAGWAVGWLSRLMVRPGRLAPGLQPRRQRSPVRPARRLDIRRRNSAATSGPRSRPGNTPATIFRSRMSRSTSKPSQAVTSRP